jgi:hypothetical protein
MTELTRYDVFTEQCDCGRVPFIGLEKDVAGYYVLATDALAAIKELEDTIAQLRAEKPVIDAAKLETFKFVSESNYDGRGYLQDSEGQINCDDDDEVFVRLKDIAPFIARSEKIKH